MSCFTGLIRKKLLYYSCWIIKVIPLTRRMKITALHLIKCEDYTVTASDDETLKESLSSSNMHFLLLNGTAQMFWIYTMGKNVCCFHAFTIFSKFFYQPFFISILLCKSWNKHLIYLQFLFFSFLLINIFIILKFNVPKSK